MIGAIIGDIAGSSYEKKPTKYLKNINFFTWENNFTDETVILMSVMKTFNDFYNLKLALPDIHVSEGVKELQNALTANLADLCTRYPVGPYGRKFREWLNSPDKKPYGSVGNGAAIRAIPIAYVVNKMDLSLGYGLMLSDILVDITHNTDEAHIGARCVTRSMLDLLKFSDRDELMTILKHNYPWFRYDGYESMQELYRGGLSCEETVPYAIYCAISSVSFEDAICKAIALDGDSDTLASLAGALAGLMYDIDGEMVQQMFSYIPKEFANILCKFYYNFIR